MPDDACELWIADHLCGTTPARSYLNGARCELHTPARMAGRAEPNPPTDIEAAS